jgi:transglutaminase-like putative cysteine protease
MAPTSETTGDRRILLAALAALAAVTGAAFARVFQGSAPAIRLAAAGALAVAVGALLARRHVLVSLIVGAAALTALIGVLVFPGTTWGGLPTLDTLSAAVAALGRATTHAAREVPPAPALPSLMTAGLIAVWAAGTAAHALALRSRSPVLAVIPPAALLGFAGLVAGQGPRPAYVVAFLAAAFAVLYGAAIENMVPWARGGAVPRAGGAGRWARRLGLAAAAVAIALPGLLPGFRAGAVLRLDRPTGRVGVSPIVDIRPSLLTNPPADLFSVRSPEPAYWRLLSLDRFNGRIWTASDPRTRETETVQEIDALFGLPPIAATRLDQVFEIQDLSTPWLPAAFQPVQVFLDDVEARWDPWTHTIQSEERTESGLTYRVESLLAIPSSAALDGIDPRRSQPEAFTALPPSLPSRVYGIARELTADAPTAVRKVLAIQSFLRTFRYDERVAAGHGVDDIVNFLERTRAGYCEQFAGTMAVLLRTLGIPSRVAIGFLPGDRDRNGAFQVTTAQVHAWPEAYFAPYGWLAFEPTPTRHNPAAGYLAQAPAGVRPDANLGTPGGAAAQSPGAAQREAFERAPNPLVGPSRAPDAARRSGWPWRRMLAWGVMAAALGALLVQPVKAARRRMLLVRARTPTERVTAAYRVALSVAVDLGLARRPGETLWEYRTRLRDRGVPPERLDRLTGLTGRALYSARGVDPAHGEQAAADARAVVSALRRLVGPARAAAGAVRPAFGL